MALVFVTGAIFAQTVTVECYEQDIIKSPDCTVCNNPNDYELFTGLIVQTIDAGDTVRKKLVYPYKIKIRLDDVLITDKEAHSVFFDFSMTAQFADSIAFMTWLKNCHFSDTSSGSGGSYSWFANGGNDIHPSTEIAAGATVNFTGLNGVVVGLPSSGSNTLNFNGELLQWFLDADSGTAGLVGDAGSQETVNILGGSGISTAISGLNVTVTNTGDLSTTNEIQGLNFTGSAGGPVTLDISFSSDDITFTAGTNITFNRVGDDLTINSAAPIAYSLSTSGTFVTTLIGSGTSVQFLEGTGIDITFGGTSGAATLTISSTVTGATPGGDQYDVQYNDPLGTFAGSSNFEFNGTDVTWTGKLLNTSFNTGSFEFQIGSLYIQEYSLNNSLIGDNTYFNGSSYTRATTGYASAVQLYNGQTMFFGANTGTGNYTISYSGKTDYTGKVGFGQGINSALGNYTGSTFYHDPATLFTGIGTISSTSLITGNDLFRVVSGSDEFAYNTFSGQGFAYLSNGTITGFIGHLSTPDGFVIGGYSNHDVVIRSNNTNRIIVDAAGNVSIGNNASPSQLLHVSGNARITGAVYDSNNDPGTSGQIMSSTVTGWDWIAPVVNTDAQTLSVSGGTSPVLNISGASSPISFAFTGGSFTSTASSITLITNDQSATNELQTVANTGTGELITTLSNSGGSWNIKLSTGLSGVRSGTALDGIFTITNTVVDTDTDDQGLTYTGAAGGPVTLAIDGGSDVTLTAGSNITFNRVGTDLEISATGAGTYSWDLGVNGGSYTTIGDAEQVSINGAGINVASIVGNVITITGTEVDGSTSNELQTVANTGTGELITTLSNTGGSWNIKLSTGLSGVRSGTSLDGIFTITNTVVDTDTDDQGLDFFNAVSPVTLYADGSADGVMFASGTGIYLAMAADVLTISATGISPGGNQYDVQYNDPLGTFAGSDNFEFNGTDVTWTGKLLNTSFNTGSFEFQIGSLYIQEYSLNNSLIGDNTYFNGSSYTRSVPGYASAVQLYNGQTLFFGSNTGTGNYTISYSGKTDYTGKFGFGQGVNSALGNYTGSTFYHDPATLFTGIGTISSTSLISGNDIFKIVSGTDVLGYNELGSNGVLYLSNGTITGFGGHVSATDGFVYGSYSNHDVAIRTNNTNRVIVDAAGNVSIGNNASPSQLLHVSGNARITGAVYDSNNDPGTSGQIMSSTVTGWDWIAPVVNTDAQTLSVSGGTSPVLNISGASSPIAFAFTGGTFTSTSSSITLIANDQSATNELQTVANTGTGELITTLSNTGGSWNIKLSTGLSGVRTGTALDGIFTITNTVVDTDTDDQGLTYTGSAGGPVTLAIDGGSDVTLTAGSNITFNRVGTDLEISATGSGTYSWDIGVNGGSYTTIGDAEQVSINGAGINVASIAGNVITITGTEVDGSTTNEIQNLTFTGAGPFTLAIDGGGTDVTFEDAGILVISRVSNELTFTATEVDGSTTNELDTWDLGANASYTTISTTEQVNFIGAGIAVSSRSGNTITYTATEVDGSTTNELQDLGFSGASSPVTLTITGGTSVSFVAGTNTTLSQSAGALTINSTGGATDLTFTGSGPFNLLSSTGTDVTITEGLNIDITRTSNDLSFKATPAGSDTYIQYNSSGSFAASADYVRNVTATIPGIVNRNYYVIEFPLNSGLGLVAKDQGSTDYLMQIGFNAQAQYGGTINTVSGSQIFIYNFQEALGDPSSYYWGFNNTGDNYWGSSSTTWSVKIQQPILSNIPLSIQGASGQTADLLNITTSGGSAGNVMTILPSGFVGLNQVTPTQQFHVVGNARITGAIYDSNNDPGTSGQLLSSTVTGSDWVTASFTDAQNLTFTGSGPFTLDISGGTDVTVSEGNNIDITRATNNLAFAAIPSGSTTHVQYNSSGVFAGNSGFTYDGTNVGWTGMMNNTSFNTTNEELQLGSGYFQAYSLNNFWIGENTIYNGSALTRPATGYASTLQLYNGQFIYYGVSSGSGTYTQNNASKIDYLGRFAIGQSIPSDFADFTNSTFYHESSSSRTGLGTISPSQTIHVVGNARVTGAYYDSNNSPGSSGEVLSSTATGTDWIAAVVNTDAQNLTFTGSAPGPYTLDISGGTDVTFTAGLSMLITRSTNDLTFRAIPPGGNGDIVFNSTGFFGAESAFFYNEASNVLGVANISLTNILYDKDGNAGTSGQVLSSTVTGTDWITISAGATDLTFTGSGPFNLLSSTGTDVTFTEGANLNITRSTNDLAFNAYPSGSSGEIQYNASGVFAADNSFLWDATNNRLAINQTSNGPGILNITINTDDYTNTANANTVFNVTNTHVSGQIVNTYTINGSLSGKTRFDNAGNLTWASYSAANDRGHYFFNGGDYPSGEANMKITRTGVVVSAVDITAETPGYAMDVRGNLSVTGTVHDASGDAGTSGQIFSSTATGTNWIAAVAPGGSNTHVQYNNSGAFGGEADFRYDASTNSLVVPNLRLDAGDLRLDYTRMDDQTKGAYGTYLPLVMSTIDGEVYQAVPLSAGYGTSMPGDADAIVGSSIITLTGNATLPDYNSGSAIAGYIIIVRNASGGAINISPPSGDELNDVTSAYSLAAGAVVMFIKFDADDWYTK